MMAARIPVPIAIIGMACRLPGNVTNTEELWDLLVEGRVGWSPVPSQRYNEAAFYHPNPENEGTTNHRGGHFISPDIAAFDASFFGISPIEAQAMDPQQRLLLETTYEAFEIAGIPIDGARGSNTAVYTAMFTRDYDRNMFKDPVDLPKYQTTGTGEAILSNRVSYVFDFKGPSMTLDTGCSGSIVALHQACQSLRTGESTMALASGVNLILSPDHMFGMTKLQSVTDIFLIENLAMADKMVLVCSMIPEDLILLTSGVQAMAVAKV
jgi:acyl transferase domain-containing protein